MEPVEVLVSEFLTGLGLGDGVRGGLDWRVQQIKQQDVLFPLHTGKGEGDRGSGDDTQVVEEEVCFWSSYTSQLFLELSTGTKHQYQDWSVFSLPWPNTWQEASQEGRDCMDSQFEGAVSHGKEGITAGASCDCGSRNMRLLIHILCGIRKQRDEYWSSTQFLFNQSGTLAHGMCHPSMGLSSSLKPLWKHSLRQRYISLVAPNSVPF